MLLPDFDVPEFVAETGFESVVGWNDRVGPSLAVSEAFGRLSGIPEDPMTAVDDELPFGFLANLRSRLGRREPTLASELLAPLRIIKSEEERVKMERAGELVSLGVDAAIESARPGISETKLRSEIERVLWDQGADSVDDVLVQSGTESASPHHQAGGRQLHKGEPVLFDIFVRMDGYFADVTQQVFLGDPPSHYVEAYEAVYAAQEAGVQAACVGATVESVHRASNQVLARAGFPSELRTGHGLGLDVHEPPSVDEGNPMVLQPNMVFTVEPGIYLTGRYGIRIEDTVLITETGPRRLTRGSRPLQVKM
jgi:Xaa-Pro aminopeptidase